MSEKKHKILGLEKEMEELEGVKKKMTELERELQHTQEKLKAMWNASLDALEFCQELDYAVSQMRGRIYESITNLKMSMKE